jgi:ankyrin repeat protein
VAVIDLLLAAGSDPNASCYTYRGGPGQTAAGLLVGSAAPREARLTLPMMAALARGGARLDAVYTLLIRLSVGDRVDLTAELAGRALAESVTLGEPTLVQALLDAGVEVDSRRGDGATALHLAAFDGDAALVEKLLARGADRSLRDNVFDGTPAGWAHAGGHTELGNRLAKPL